MLFAFGQQISDWRCDVAAEPQTISRHASFPSQAQLVELPSTISRYKEDEVRQS